MNTFENELRNRSLRWKDNSFIESQILSHFEEIEDLIHNKEEHRFNESIDLINILSAYLTNNKNELEIKDIISKRMEKFFDKSKRKKEWRISLTENCNYRCFFCHEEGLDMEKRRKPKTTEEIYSVIKKGVELGYSDITFTGGEPLIRKKDILWILNKLNEECLFPDITIVTNGYLVDDEFLDELCKYRGYVKFNFSMHSVNKDEYYKIVNPVNGDKNSFDKIVANIDKIVKKGIVIKLNFVLLKGINSSKESIKDIVDFGIRHGINYIKFLELLVTEKLKNYYNYYFDVASVKNYFENEFEELESAPRRVVYSYKGSGMKIELQTCTCRVGCNKCISLRDKTVTSELEFFPCFVLNSKGIDVSNSDKLEEAFNKGDRDIAEMAKKYRTGSPIIVSNPVYKSEKIDIYYKCEKESIEEINRIFEENGYKLERKTSLKELYYEPIFLTEKWKEYNKIFKLFSVNYKASDWKEVRQEITYFDEEIFYCKTKFLDGVKEKIVKNIADYEEFLKYMEFKKKKELNWEIEFWEKDGVDISCAQNIDTGKIVFRTAASFLDKEITDKMRFENIKTPLLKYILEE